MTSSSSSSPCQCPRSRLRADAPVDIVELVPRWFPRRRRYAGALAVSTQWFSRPLRRARSHPCPRRGRTGVLTIAVHMIYVGEGVSVLVMAVVYVC